LATFKGKTIFITGSSRGIGKAIALKLASEGANIAIIAKTTEPHPKLEGTIFTAAEDIEKAGGNALPIKTDIRNEDEIAEAVAKTVDTFGGIDILINNASAIDLTPTEHIPIKKYDLMHQVNVRATFICSQKCLPYLKKSENPHILNISPPLNMDKKWFGPHVAYTMTKYGMSMCVLGMAEEFKKYGIGVNALWAKTLIATAAVKNLLGGSEMIQKSRTPEIMADAAYFILKKEAKIFTGHFLIDEDVVIENGNTDLKKYAVNPNETPFPDIFL
jgi:citronellol/citronellal dehydrogenase